MAVRKRSHLNPTTLLSFFSNEPEELESLDSSEVLLDIISLLPMEMSVFTLKYLSAKDLCRAQQVNTKWLEVCQHPALQQRIRKLKVEFIQRKENNLTPTDRLKRRSSVTLINRNVDSPFSSLQEAGSSSQSSLVASQFPSESFLTDLQRFYIHQARPCPVGPHPQLLPRAESKSNHVPVYDKTVVLSRPTSSKASKSRLKRF